MISNLSAYFNRIGTHMSMISILKLKYDQV
jgi:hypothetical protein